MKRVLPALVLAFATPLIGCEGTAPPETADTSTSALTKLQPCASGWNFHYCVTPDYQTVTDVSYLRTNLTCGWTEPYHFGCSVGSNGEALGGEGGCRQCQTASGDKWTTLRYHWYRQQPNQISPPTDAQINANPNGYNAYGAYANGF